MFGGLDAELVGVLAELQAGVQAALGERYVGMYLLGSIAVGDFDKHSDVDFVVVIDGEVDAGHLTGLQSFHARIYALPSRWAQHLEGPYLTRGSLRLAPAECPKHLYLDHGSEALIWSDHDNMIVNRYVLREKGVALDGPDTSTLVDPVPTEALREEMYAQLDQWMGGFLLDPTPLENGWRQPYTVLTLCRMLCTVQHGMVMSKRVAAEWALDTLDERWVGLIERAWAKRPDPALTSRTQADPADVAATVALIRYALDVAAAAKPGALRLVPRGGQRRLGPFGVGPPTS